MEPQSFSVKRAEVEFHGFASLGQPERVIATYAEENHRRLGLIRKHADFIGPLSPFLELGANAGIRTCVALGRVGGSSLVVTYRLGRPIRRSLIH